MEVQPQLVLLQKTLLNIEGLGRTLYPQLDLWATAKPFLERWVKEQVGPKALLKRVKESLPGLSEQLPEMLPMAYRVLKDAEQGTLKLQWQSDQLQQIQEEIRRANRRTLGAVTGGVLVVGSILIAAFPPAWITPAIIQAGMLGGIAAGLGVMIKSWW